MALSEPFETPKAEKWSEKINDKKSKIFPFCRKNTKYPKMMSRESDRNIPKTRLRSAEIMKSVVSRLELCI